VSLLAVSFGVLEWSLHRTACVTGFWLFSVTSGLKDAYELKWPYSLLLVWRWAPALYSWCTQKLYTTVAGLVGRMVE
jgi:hypothetical protein